MWLSDLLLDRVVNKTGVQLSTTIWFNHCVLCFPLFNAILFQCSLDTLKNDTVCITSSQSNSQNSVHFCSLQHKSYHWIHMTKEPFFTSLRCLLDKLTIKLITKPTTIPVFDFLLACVFAFFSSEVMFSEVIPFPIQNFTETT